jgi:hypothetical protein
MKQVARKALLAIYFMIVSCLAYYLILKMEAICSSETPVDFQWTARRYKREDGTIQYLYCHIFVFLCQNI